MTGSDSAINTQWAVALGLGFPLALLILNECIVRLAKTGSLLTSTLASTRNYLLPALGLAIMLRNVLGFPADGTANLVAQTLLWVVLLFVALGFVNAAVFGGAREGTWRANVPELLRDVVRSLLVGIGAAFIYSQIWGKELAGALTALGVGSLVIGLALQEPLGNVFSGIMLLFERPVSTGDWINVDGRTGRVIAMNWRAVNIETLTRELIVVPNSSLYKTSFANLSRPTRIRTEVIEFSFSYDNPPNEAKHVLMDILKTTPGVLEDPPPVVRTDKFADSAIVYKAIFSVRDMESLPEVRDHIMTRTYYASKRAGLEIPFPISIELSGEEVERMAAKRAVNPLTLLAKHPLFQPPHNATSENLKVLRFAEGELLLHEGDQQDGICLIVEGRTVLTAVDAQGSEVQLGVLGPGDFYGEQSVLAGQSSLAAVRALTDTQVVWFDLETSRQLVEQSPKLARSVGETIDQRRRAVQALRKKNSAAASASG